MCRWSSRSSASASSSTRLSAARSVAMARDHGQDQRRGITSLMKHRLFRFGEFCDIGVGSGRIQVAIEARKITARNFHTNAMTTGKNITGHARIDADLVDSVSFDKYGVSQREAITHSLYAIADTKRAAVGL